MGTQISLKLSDRVYSSAKIYSETHGFDTLQDFIRELIRERLFEGEIEGFEVVCPRHGARFDIQTGKVTALPAVEDIPAYPVQVVDGQIEVGIPAAG